MSLQNGTGLAVCIPTYNERENLEAVAGRVTELLPQARLIIIDDNSPDGTGPLADKLSLANDNITVIHREKKDGLGPAYFAGFREALSDQNITHIAQMDADGSHDVGSLVKMTEYTDKHRLVTGSRYVKGGGVSDWALHRRIISRMGSIYARLFLGGIAHDFTSGFKIWPREILQQAIADEPFSSGYVFQVEMTYRAHKCGAEVMEFPIVFREREKGISKMSLSIALEAAVKVPLIKFKSLRKR